MGMKDLFPLLEFAAHVLTISSAFASNSMSETNKNVKTLTETHCRIIHPRGVRINRREKAKKRNKVTKFFFMLVFSTSSR